MQASDIPEKFVTPFANAAGGGYVRAIPAASQIGIVDGAASLADGFPPDTFVAVAAGGVPPFGQDFNGILKQVTAWSRWMSAGGRVAWDSAFSASIGGYPNGAIVGSPATAGLAWRSTTDNNVTNPDTGGAGWVRYPFSQSGEVAAADLAVAYGPLAAANSWVSQQTMPSLILGAGAFGTGNAARGVRLGDYSFSTTTGFIWERLPNGFIVQSYLGTNSTGADGIAFPIAFPNNCLHVTASEQSPGGWVGGTRPTIFGTQTISNVGFDLYVSAWTGAGWVLTGGVGYRYLAVGY